MAEKYSEEYGGSLAFLKNIFKAHGIPLRSWWGDFAIKPEKYQDREVKVRFTNNVEQVLKDLGTYFSSGREFLPSKNLRDTRVFYCEDQQQIPRYFDEVEAKDANQSLLGAVKMIGELNIGDILVVVSKYQPVNPNGSYGRKWLEITVAGYDIRKPLE